MDWFLEITFLDSFGFWTRVSKSTGRPSSFSMKIMEDGRDGGGVWFPAGGTRGWRPHPRTGGSGAGHPISWTWSNWKKGGSTWTNLSRFSGREKLFLRHSWADHLSTFHWTTIAAFALSRYPCPRWLAVTIWLHDLYLGKTPFWCLHLPAFSSAMTTRLCPPFLLYIIN